MPTGFELIVDAILFAFALPIILVIVIGRQYE